MKRIKIKIGRLYIEFKLWFYLTFPFITRLLVSIFKRMCFYFYSDIDQCIHVRENENLFCSPRPKSVPNSDNTGNYPDKGSFLGVDVAMSHIVSLVDSNKQVCGNCFMEMFKRHKDWLRYDGRYQNIEPN